METIVWALVFVVVIASAGAVLMSVTARSRTRAERRLERLERKVDAVLEHLGVPFGEPGLEQVEAHLREGRKLHAIKAYREQTGAGLAEAKEAVERMAR